MSLFILLALFRVQVTLEGDVSKLWAFGREQSTVDLVMKVKLYFCCTSRFEILLSFTCSSIHKADTQEKCLRGRRFSWKDNGICCDYRSSIPSHPLGLSRNKTLHV